MKVVILAGGFGTRLSEETVDRPKPMVEIGGMPIIWHIMKHYSFYGFNDFVICLGYKGYMIKEYFANYFIHMSDVTVDLKNNKIEVHSAHAEPWKVTMVDTGTETMTGGRLKRVQEYVGEDTFMMTYGDGVSDLNLKSLVKFHKSKKVKATLTAVKPTGKWGQLDIGQKDIVESFVEKPKGDGSYINGGFFVLEPEVFDFIKGDSTIWERDPLEGLAKGQKLAAYKYDGFWYAMDTLRDKMYLENQWASGQAPWKSW
ncbi:MAG TPA: glucose-1-phosphate cytidylyltransferase [Methanomassiliicoccales archaeon]|jgi:glucose-1-phosphate cytidylyltransferase